MHTCDEQKRLTNQALKFKQSNKHKQTNKQSNRQTNIRKADQTHKQNGLVAHGRRDTAKLSGPKENWGYQGALEELFFEPGLIKPTCA